MAHIASSQTAANTAEASESLGGDSEGALEGTSDQNTQHSSDSEADGARDSLSCDALEFHEKLVSVEKGEQPAEQVQRENRVRGCLEDTSCGVKKKNMPKSRKENKVRSECHRTIKVRATEAPAVSAKLDELVEGSGASLNNLATPMERVNADSTYYGRPGSPYISSENDWEASDSDVDHSDSSDDDNPKSQVDRWIDCEAIQFMDGENSNLSSETDDTSDDDHDSDSDITDVSPLVSTGTSPLFGLSPAVSRRNLPSSFSSRQPFMRHYSHRGHDGDVEDEEEDDQHNGFRNWSDEFLNNHQTSTDILVNDHDSHSNDNQTLDHKHNMSLVVQALLKLNMERAAADNEHLDGTNKNKNDHHFSNMMRRHSHINPALHANPHHRHLRKHSHPKRKNMTFTNEEVRIINRDNSVMLDKLLAVHNRQERIHNKHQNSKPASATVNRKKQEEGIRKENYAILRRLQDVKPSKAVSVASRGGKHHHSHHHGEARSCSATARHSATFSPAHHHHSNHHHTPKETAL